jgi:glycosyltransferase XagB
MKVDDKYPGSGLQRQQYDQEAGLSALLSLARTSSPSATLSRHSKPEPSSSASPSLDAGFVPDRPITGPPIDYHRSVPGLRAVRFGAIAVSCALIQLLILKLLSHQGVNKILANGIGFAASAQVFFILNAFFSRFARKPGLAERTRSRNATKADAGVFRRSRLTAIALVALAVNEIVFVITLRRGVPLFIGSATGILCGTIMASSVNYVTSYRDSAPQNAGLETTEHVRSRFPRHGDHRLPAPRAAALPALSHDARVTATRSQRWVLLSLAALLVLVLAAATVGVRTPLLVVVALVTILYLADLLFCVYLMTGSMRRDNRTPAPIVRELEWWPTYTVLCPMYRETAVLPQFVAAITKLDYPAQSLQVLLLLEEDDHDTIDFARRMDLPASFEIVVVPDSQPKTKPKACNYGLHVARGDYVVIFDAEDVPEPDQLKKAVLAFAELPGAVACLQAPLNFYNPRQNVLTRLFTAEYSLWFDLMLVGLQRLRGPIPLGGTSNHFRVEVLRGLGGWDPYNVTEDADLGIRLYKRGFRTGMLDSTTYEEANPDPRNWIRQRSRWIKGYLQTLLVHTRGGWDLRRTRDPHFFTFLLVIGGKAIVNFINPLLWAATISYFVFRASIGPPIKALYPAPVFYFAVITLVFGNLLFVYTFLLGSARRGNYDLIKYGLLAPLYWLMMSAAAVKGLTQLIRNPHYWEKTKHGLHLEPGADHTAERHDLELVRP